MPDKTIAINLLKAGDIVIFHGGTGVAVAQGAAQLLKMITVLPALASAARTGALGLTGNIKASHCGLVTTGGANASYAHARMSGVSVDDLTVALCTFANGDRVQLEHPWIYRPTQPLTGRNAAEVAELWSKPGLSGQLTYSMGSAIGAAFGSSSFGSGAKQRAQAFRQARMTRGGPQGALKAHSATFCSAFVVACYQAVLSEIQSSAVMSLDALHTSPAVLQNYLGNSGSWRYEGRLLV